MSKNGFWAIFMWGPPKDNMSVGLPTLPKIGTLLGQGSWAAPVGPAKKQTRLNMGTPAKKKGVYIFDPATSRSCVTFQDGDRCSSSQGRMLCSLLHAQILRARHALNAQDVSWCDFAIGACCWYCGTELDIILIRSRSFSALGRVKSGRIHQTQPPH